MYCNSNEEPPGFEVKHVNDYIGQCVFATKNFLKGEFLLQYKGDLIKNQKRAKQLEKEYADNELGCFMYYFKYKEKTMCIDATNDIFAQGRMISDAEKGDPMQNCCLKIVEVDGVPTLCTFATRNIANGEKLRYDYGVPNLPWRKKYIKKVKDTDTVRTYNDDLTKEDQNETPPSQTNAPQLTSKRDIHVEVDECCAEDPQRDTDYNTPLLLVSDTHKSGNNCTKEENKEENSPTQMNDARQIYNLDNPMNEVDEYHADTVHMDFQNDTPLLLSSDANIPVAEIRDVIEDDIHEATGSLNESKTTAVKETETSENYSEDSAKEDEDEISPSQTDVPRGFCKKPSPVDGVNENGSEYSHKVSDEDTPLLHSSEQLTDDVMKEIAASTSKDVRALGQDLELDNSEVDKCINEHPHNTEDQKLALLVAWRESAHVVRR